MRSIVKLSTLAVLLATLAGCAGMMPNWTPNVPTDSMQSPAIYADPADG